MRLSVNVVVALGSSRPSVLDNVNQFSGLGLSAPLRTSTNQSKAPSPEFFNSKEASLPSDIDTEAGPSTLSAPGGSPEQATRKRHSATNTFFIIVRVSLAFEDMSCVKDTSCATRFYSLCKRCLKLRQQLRAEMLVLPLQTRFQKPVEKSLGIHWGFIGEPCANFNTLRRATLFHLTVHVAVNHRLAR